MATTNQQLVYAAPNPAHNVVQYEYYTQQLPQNASAYATAAPVEYGGSHPPQAASVAAEQTTDGTAKRSSDEAINANAGPNKKPRPNSAWGSGEIYPQRPGEKMCAYYMTTRLCSFGVTCRYDHPAWVPAGGIPNWKELMKMSTSSKGSCLGDQVTPDGTPVDPGSLPQRPTEPDCAYFLKTGECRYGSKCRFNHPMEKLETRTSDEQSSDASHAAVTMMPPTPATAFNSRGLPLRPGDGNCVFYGKTGSCKFGAACRYNHPEILVTGGRTGATLQPQQPLFVQSQQQPNVQYQVVQATQDYAYPTTTTFQSTTPTYTTAASAYPNTTNAYPVATTYTTAASPYAPQPATSYPSQQVMQTVEYVYTGGPPMQVYPTGTTTQGYPPGTPTQGYPQGTVVQQYPQGTTTQVFSQAQSYPPGAVVHQGLPQGTTSQPYPPGTNAQTQQQTYPSGATTSAHPPGTPQSCTPGATTQPYPPGTTTQTVEYTYTVGQQQPLAQQEYVYATQQSSQNGTERAYSSDQPLQQPTSEQYTTAYATDAAGQPTTTEYAYATAQNPQEYAYAVAQGYHQSVPPVYVTPMSLPHPQRPGEPDCSFYMKTGECSFGATCKYHHPPDRVPSGIPKLLRNQVPVTLSLAGLPRRENEAACTYYMKTGTCKFGQTCKYDHPPPQEMIARAVEAARGEIPGSHSYDANLPVAAPMESESQDTNPLPPGTDVPPVTAAVMQT